MWRIRTLFALAVLCFGIGSVVPAVGSRDDKPADKKPADKDAKNFDPVIEGIFAMTNDERVDAGRPRLTKNDKLMTAAKDYAALMSKLDQMGHSVGGQTVPERLAKVGYVWRTYGENVAYNSRPDAQATMAQWMGSPGHKANILNRNFTEIGIGVAGPSARGRYYYCQIFGRQTAGTAFADLKVTESSSSTSAEGSEDK